MTPTRTTPPIRTTTLALVAALWLTLPIASAANAPLGDARFSGMADLPTNAVGEVVTYEAVRQTGLVSDYQGGVIFTASAGSVDAVAAAFAERLADLGFTIDHDAGARTLRVERDGHAYRAVFGATENGVQVYLGR